MKKIKRMVELYKKVKKMEKDEEEQRELEERDRQYVRRKDRNYFVDGTRGKISLAKAYALICDLVIEEKDILDEEEIEWFLFQKKGIEEWIVLTYMRENGWVSRCNKDGNVMYKKEDSK